MRIQHNIMAMNAYRNYTNNTSALSKNLEKLSSGYKINRAGDDAAGLAISEKMRAQITGLDKAQDNAKDGISLVQTAEGALTEVHDMLNRMVELATQSANGTYDNDVDRANLQAEMDQLMDEIDRIADSANFNGIKLLNGDLAASTVEYTDATGSLNIPAAGTTIGTDSVLHENGTSYRAPSFEVDLSGFNFEATADDATFDVDVAGLATITVESKTSTDGTPGTAFVDGDTMSAEELAAYIADQVNANDSAVASSTGDNFAGVDIGGAVYTARVEGSKVIFELSEVDVNDAATDAQTLDGATDAIPQTAVTIGNAADGTLSGVDAINAGNTTIHAGSAATPSSMASTVLTMTNNVKDGGKLTIGNATYVFKVGADSTTTAADGETLIDLSAFEETDTNLVDEAIALLTQQSNSNEWFSIGSNQNGQITVTEKATYAGEGDLTTLAGLQSNFKLENPGAPTEDNSLTLQIGDTSDPYNQLTVGIQDMHADTLGLRGVISIANQNNAQAAIDKIKAAINTVSSVRGNLGAIQNRLDHTINNLSVMEENIQDAESSIRDTDVAEEMMAYTKNNILVQSAQAMLAQANQVPQGVLQLLQ